MTSNKQRVEVCFSPNLYPLYAKTFAFDWVVVIDVLRATSAMITGLAHKVKAFVPIANLEDAYRYQQQGYIVAAERNGQTLEDFPLGNSPLSYINGEYKDETIVITTTNGTQGISIAAQDEKQILLASFINLSAVIEQLIHYESSVLILCSGWKNKFNMEDTVCAGALVHELIKSGIYFFEEDSSLAAEHLFLSMEKNYKTIFKASSHRKRLQNLGLQEDIKYCLKMNILNTVPVWYQKKIMDLALIKEDFEFFLHQKNLAWVQKNEILV